MRHGRRYTHTPSPNDPPKRKWVGCRSLVLPSRAAKSAESEGKNDEDPAICGAFAR